MLGTRASARRFVTKLEKQAFTTREFIKLGQVATVGTSAVCCGSTFVEVVARVLSIFHMFREVYDLEFLRAEEVGTVQDMMLFDFVPGMSPSTYRSYVQVRTVTLERPPLLDVMKEPNEEFPSSQCLGVSARYEFVFDECEGETALCLFHSANAFICHRNAFVLSADLLSVCSFDI